MPRSLTIGDSSLDLDDVVRVARAGVRVRLARGARSRMNASRRLVDDLVESGATVYGVTTGFGAQSDVRIDTHEQYAIQPKILRSHAAGTGQPLSPDIARAVVFLRANMLAKGHSGVRPVIVETLLRLLNAGITPIVPEQGSVGASGDLAPLAAVSLPLIGEGWVFGRDGRPVAAGKALSAAGIAPVRLQSKEAASLTNGTEASLGVAALATYDSAIVLDAAHIAAAMSFTAMGGHIAAYDERIQALRPHAGQIEAAGKMRSLLHGPNDENVEPRRPIHDIYSLRCVPQVMGPALEAVAYARHVIDVELNSVTDNPLLFPNSAELLSGGNFHGHPVSVLCDFLKVAVASIGTFAERRIASLLDSRASGLPDHLTPNPQANFGFMLVQYAAASLVNENKTLTHPSSVDSITTAAGAEDYNSMSLNAARHLRDVVTNTRRIVAIELLCAAQGMDLANRQCSPAVAAAHAEVRAKVPALQDDTSVVTEMIGAIETLIASGKLGSIIPDGR